MKLRVHAFTHVSKINKNSITNRCEIGIGKSNAKSRTKIGFGRVLGLIWESFGRVWAVSWEVLGALGKVLASLGGLLGSWKTQHYRLFHMQDHTILYYGRGVKICSSGLCLLEASWKPPGDLQGQEEVLRTRSWTTFKKLRDSFQRSLSPKGSKHGARERP